ncbi:kinase-like domain-containing protein, partial [Kockovaella imperatae]
WSLLDFEIGKPLGKGNFGKVYLAKVKSDNPFILCLKCLDKHDIVSHNIQTQVRREVEIMQSIRHPNILRLYGWFHDQTRIMLMIEFAGKGEVFKHLRQAKRFSEKRSARASSFYASPSDTYECQYIRQVADGLAYLHSKDIIHRDIKPENLFLGGWLRRMSWTLTNTGTDGQRTIAGTLSYVAPEIILGKSYGRAVDIWALGVLSFEFICGEEPFGSDPASRICRCDVVWPEHVSSEARDFIGKLMRIDSHQRMPLCEVPNHPWIKLYHIA